MKVEKNPLRHVLHTSAGFVVEMFLDELSGQMRCEWSPHPPRTASQMRRVIREYELWRNDIVSQLVAAYRQKSDDGQRRTG